MLEEADVMQQACDKAGVLLLYAEELFFAPKYVKAQMADEGASTQVHKDRTLGEDEALTTIEFANGATGVAENSWTKAGRHVRRRSVLPA